MPPSPRIHGVMPRGQAGVARSSLHEGRFGRMFRSLAPAPHYDLDRLKRLAGSMRERGGGPRGDNPDIPAGYTYFGQFLDHDITFDASSRLQVHNDPDALVDFRTPRYDLDSVYGSGPVDEPFQYDQRRPGRLLVGDNGNGEPDLPRNEQGVALIGDPRNDENVIVSGLQILMLRLHNRIADIVDADPSCAPEERFDETRRRVRWHYQWVVVHDYLPRICGSDLMSRLLTITDGEPRYRLRFYNPAKNAYMPIEFSAAAFRFGHAQVRPAYDLNQHIGVKPIFAAGNGQGADLSGGRPLQRDWSVDWTRFLPIGGSTPQASRLIDSKLSAALFDLSRVTAGQRSLPLRNLLRGQDMDLPSGQDLAAALGIEPLRGAQLDTDLDPTPLWFYLLKESELSADEEGNRGRRLGPTGARLIAEVLVGLLRSDPSSYLNREPMWNPALSGSSGKDGTFGLADLVDFARA